ncbi:sugar kinase [Candidatus Uhrbacteria bacterium]|nr:sugar kinase [Candidatus Uhrbacteria bacterium]
MPTPIERVVLVTKSSRLAELLDRYCGRDRVRFVIESRGESFAEYEAEDDRWRMATDRLRAAIPREIAHTVISRAYIPTELFRPTDLVMTIGPDGLVANAAKYLDGPPILAVNPDPDRIDGTIARFSPDAAIAVLPRLLRGQYRTDPLTIAMATTNDGQVAYAANDFLVGRRDTVSARYRLGVGNGPDVVASERQSSSGVLVTTGLGSTAWATSIVSSAFAIAAVMVGFGTGEDLRGELRVQQEFEVPYPWSARHLLFFVREAFPTRSTSARQCFGRIEETGVLVITSEMPDGGAIFSDGVVEDALPFLAGTTVTIRPADRVAQLIRP